jgi:hypothetical protein
MPIQHCERKGKLMLCAHIVVQGGVGLWKHLPSEWVHVWTQLAPNFLPVALEACDKTGNMMKLVVVFHVSAGGFHSH